MVVGHSALVGSLVGILPVGTMGIHAHRICIEPQALPSVYALQYLTGKIDNK